MGRLRGADWEIWTDFTYFIQLVLMLCTGEEVSGENWA